MTGEELRPFIVRRLHRHAAHKIPVERKADLAVRLWDLRSMMPLARIASELGIGIGLAGTLESVARNALVLDVPKTHVVCPRCKGHGSVPREEKPA